MGPRAAPAPHETQQATMVRSRRLSQFCEQSFLLVLAFDRSGAPTVVIPARKDD